MYISKILLENVRQFEKVEFCFQPGFNLIIGENGIGKTTILNSLRTSIGSKCQTGKCEGLKDQDIRIGERMLRIETSVHKDENCYCRLTYGKRFGRRATRKGNGSELTVLYYGANESSAGALKRKRIPSHNKENSFRDIYGEEFLYQSETLSEEAGLPVKRFGRSAEIRSFLRDMLERVFPNLRDFHWRFEPYQCSIKISNNETGKEIKGKKALESAIIRHLLEQPDNLRGIDQRMITLNSKGELYEKSASRKITPPFFEILQNYEIGGDTILSESTAEVRLTPRIVIGTSMGDFLLSQLSDGEQRLFSLIVDIARVLSLYSKNSIGETPSVVLIDEIDVHLHPRWQRILVPTLEDLFPRCQFIATTHSPFIIQAINLRKVICIGRNGVLYNDNDSISIEDIVEDIQGVDMPQRGSRHERMSQAAERYFRLLQQEKVNEDDLFSAENEYRLASEPFTSKPAINALLRVQKIDWRSRKNETD